MHHFWFYFLLYSIVFKYNFIKLILPPVFSGGFFIVNLIYKSGKNVDEYKDYSTYTKITPIKCKKVVWTLKKGVNKIWILFIKAGE